MIQTVYDFAQANGRIPMLESGDKPWHYKGWLLH